MSQIEAVNRDTFLSVKDSRAGTGTQASPWGWFGALGLVVVAVLSQSGTKKTSASEAPVSRLIANDVVAGTDATEIEAAVSEATLKLAARHVGIALGADGMLGATAYSLNCWASLERRFSLSKTERCAAFDALVLANWSEPDAATPWFAEGAVSARYLSALNIGRSGIQDATGRLERLRLATALQDVKIIAPKEPKLQPAPATDDAGDEEADSTEVAGSVGDNSTNATWQ
jgi:hypothetical protein